MMITLLLDASTTCPSWRVGFTGQCKEDETSCCKEMPDKASRVEKTMEDGSSRQSLGCLTDCKSNLIFMQSFTSYVFIGEYNYFCHQGV